MTGYPSIDKPWLRYYSEEAIEAPLPECSISEHLWQNNADHPADVAITYLGRRITYGELFRRIEVAASAFTALGIVAGDYVTLALPNIPENVVALYALNRIGAIPDLIDLRSPADELARCMSDTSSRVAVVCDLFLDSALAALSKTEVRHLIVASPYDELPFPVAQFLKRKHPIPKGAGEVDVLSWKAFMRRGTSPASSVPQAGSDVAVILHTSGTTGTPKSVMLTNLSFNAMVEQYRHCGLEFSEGDSFLNQIPPFVAFSVILATHLPLCLRMKLIMLPDYVTDDFASRVIKYRPNHVIEGPACFDSFLNVRKAQYADFSYLKTLASGGDTMRPERKAAVNELLAQRGCSSSVIEGYGMSEVGSAACTNLPQCDVPGTVGIPLPKMTVCIWDSESDSECGYGVSGEICFSGPTMMAGYLHDETSTNEIIKIHPDGKRWLHTGDLGHFDKRGCIHFEGRLKRIILRYDSFKVSPFDIEHAALSCQGVTEACAVGIPNDEYGVGQDPVLWIVADQDTDETDLLSRVDSACHAKLPEKALPTRILLCDSMPLTSTGKVDYRELERRAAELVGDDEGV